MDPFTQRLMDRARSRRENLEKKMAEQSVPRKRSVPLSESNSDNATTPPTSQDDDSPKRQCVRMRETEVKADTPAIQGVKARSEVLSKRGGQMEVDDYVPPLRRHAEPTLDTENTAPRAAALSNRRGRFAALASTINTWEDDLSHHRIKPVEESTKKVWQPLKPVEEPVSRPDERKAMASSEIGPQKPSRTFQHDPSSDPAPAHRSPVKEKTVVSSITLTLGNNSPRAGALKIVPGTTTTVSPSVMNKGAVDLEFVPGTTTCVSPNVKKIGSASNLNQSPKPFRSATASSPSRVARSPVKEVVNASDEPTVQPVSSRMAAWKEATAGGKSKEDEGEPTKQPVAARKGLWEQKITLAEKEKNPISPIKPGQVSRPTRPQSAVVMREKPGRTIRDPTEESVHNRMSLWEKRVTDSKQDDAQSATRPASAFFKAGIAKRAAEMQGRRQSPVKASPVSVKSPEKVGPAMRTLADRLAGVQQGWQNNEIAEKIKQQKEAELNMLQNRWKNGMPTLGGGQQPEDEPSGVATSSTTGPPPPPLPSSPRKKTISSPSKNSPVKVKRETAREVIRAASVDEHKQQEDGGPTQPANFESKLRAMGFDMHSTADVGKVAVVDLKAQKQRDAEIQVRSETEKHKATSQVKVVGVTESRMTTTTFGDESVSVKKTITPGAGHHTSTLRTTLSSAPPTPTGTSIYNLIKNKTATTPSAGPTNKYPTYQSSSKHQDSFESDSSSFAEETEEETAEEPTDEELFKVPTGGHRVQRATSRASVYSSSSEYSEQTDCTEETEDQEGEYTEDQEGEYTEEDEYSEEDEEEISAEDDGEIDDLLDEAMDDTTTTETETESDYPMAAPRHRPSQQPAQGQYHGHTEKQSSIQARGREQDQFRVPQPQQRRRDNQHVTFASNVDQGFTSSSTGGTSSGTSTGTSGTESDTDEQRTVYSIDMYRRGTSQRGGPVPKMTIVRHSEHTKRASVPEEPLPYIPEKSTRQKLQELQGMINQEQSVIQQTSNALNQCCGANSSFAGSTEAVECHRLLLIACKKREGYLAEMLRLREDRPQASEGPRGSLTISDIRLPLKSDFTQKIGTPSDTTQHFFICLLRNGANTIVTQMVSTHDAMVRDTLDIPNMFKLSDVTQNFKYDLEIYSMQVSREQNVTTPKKKSKSATPKKGLFGSLKPSTPRSLQSPGGPSAVRSTSFTQIANLPITMRSLNKTHFSLDRVPYACPLQGTIHVRLHCLMETCIEERGFLTMFDDVGGFGAWHRRWCILRNNSLSFWKYPDDENIKDPIGIIDLKSCITDRVGLIPRDICARPNTFELITVRRQHRGDSNNLVTRCVNTMTTTRHQLSADTKEDRLAWCDTLNRALTSLRTWNPDAMRPVKMQ